MASIEDVLLAAAQQEQAEKLSQGEAALLAAGLGAGAGAAVGDIPQRIIGAIQPKPTDEIAIVKRKLTPGLRVKLAGLGGLGAAGVGAILAQPRPSQAAVLLAKAQTGDELSASDIEAIRNVLANYYSNTGAA